MKDNMDNASPEHAVAYLRRCGVDAVRTDYGFRILLPEISGRTFADCGMDNDSSISLSVNTDESPPVIWFFRKDYLEMADFIAQAYAGCGDGAPTRAAIVRVMRALEKTYDDTALREMTAAYLDELEDDQGPA
ncbi:hypothetical protein [uncultured Hyphomonas sp.]|uniref:hypothetical protein n=1 Tax=uncultured Hyphomonas sp. TaxID=225298 RepID=UPI002AAB1B82|nr:hypothetical protein [uncultured Hyphomonas sp.]